MEKILDFCSGHNLEIFEHNKVLLNEGDKKSIFYVLLDGKIEISKGGVNVATVHEQRCINRRDGCDFRRCSYSDVSFRW